MTIGERIKNRRIELGMSVDDLARALGKNRATVYRYESNYIQSYKPDVLAALAKALNTVPSYFYGYDDLPPDDPVNDQPVTSEARILAKGIDRLPQAEREQALAVVRAMFNRYAEYFDKEEPDPDDHP